MSAHIHHFTPRPNLVAERAAALTDPTAMALNALGELAKTACWLAARGYVINGTSTGKGRIYLSDGHYLRRHETCPCILVRYHHGIVADLAAENVGRYTANDGTTRVLYRGSNPAWPKVAIYWTYAERGPICAA